MKAPVSASKPADLGVGDPELWNSDRGNRNKGDYVYLGSGPHDGGKTLHPALVYINEDVSSTELIYLEIVMCGLTLGLGE